MKKPRDSTPVDVHVGKRVRQAREEFAMTQGQLAQKLRITFQQVQKYEAGTNRISASRLFEIAGILDKPIEWFFEGTPGNGHDQQQ